MNPTKQLLQIDTTDDRREIWHLLHKLPPKDRVRFLQWACAQCPTVKGRLPVPSVWQMQTRIADAERDDKGDERLTNEIYGDLLICFGQWELDSLATACELEQWVKRPSARNSLPRAGVVSASGERRGYCSQIVRSSK